MTHLDVSHIPSQQVNPLPSKLRCFVLNARSGTAAGVPFRLALSLYIINNTTGEQIEQLIPGPTLASDHVGYISFDIKSHFTQLQKHAHIAHLWLEPLIDGNERIDVLKLIDFGNDKYPLAIKVNLPANFDSTSPLPSIVSPDVEDWRLSPGSFGFVSLPAIGEDGCELLLPSNATEHTFKFHQLVRQPTLHPEDIPHIDNYGTEFRSDGIPPLQVRRGALRHYEMRWNPLSHGLGQVLYSLTLAPCESVNLAVIDWTREEQAARDEETGVAENLVHNQRRDRVIEEAVEATLQEWQSGDSFMGGTAGTGGYGGGGWGQMWGVTGSHSLGYGMASTEGTRTAEADTTQHLADRIQQATSMARQLRSTVVTQATQAEREQFETRTVTNHNHCHALTVLYYEVVRHYLVSTRFVGEQEVLFVRYKQHKFLRDDRETIQLLHKYRHVLLRNLLDPQLAASFDIVDEDFMREKEEIQNLETGEIRRLLVKIYTGSDGTEEDRVRLVLVSKRGTIFHQPLELKRELLPHYHNNSGNWFIDKLYEGNDQANTVNTFFVDLEPPMPLSDVSEAGIAWNKDGNDDWHFKGISITAIVHYNNGETDTVPVLSKTTGTSDSEMVVMFKSHGDWIQPVSVPDYSSRKTEINNKKRRLTQLIDHLDLHQEHYNTVMWLNENPNERARRFEEYVFTRNYNGDIETGRLIEFIENVPLGVFGDYVAFLAGPFQPYELDTKKDETLHESILSIPTRGAFAETKLSNCNACEEIDDTRFWDWQESPCAEAPAITGISPQARAAMSVPRASTLPAAGIGVEGVESAPAPVGLAEVFELLRTPDIFRDLSTAAELRPLLETLVEVAGEVEKARIAKLDASYEPSDNGADGQSRGTGQSSMSTVGGQSQGSSSSSSRERAATAQRAVREIQRAVQRGLPEEQAHELTYRTLENTFAGGRETTDLLSQEGIQNLIGSTGVGSRMRVEREGESFEYDGTNNPFEGSQLPIQPIGWWNESTIDTVEEFTVCAPFNSNYAQFRQNVVQSSPELREGMIYRSDRDHPENVIDRREDLRDIHNGYSQMGIADGTTVCLLGYIVRDARHYVMLIRFATRDIHDFSDEPPIMGTVSRNQLITDALTHARRVASDIIVEQPKDRILCMIDLADRVGPEQAYELFTLYPLHVAMFIDMSEARKAGELSMGIPPENYKMYPIRIIAYQLYFSPSYRDDDDRFRQALMALDLDIHNSIHSFSLALRSGSNIYGDNFYRLRDWLRTRQEDVTSIYSCYSGDSSRFL